MKEKIFLLSDGRVVDSRNGKIASETFSKVHKLSNKVGMLTAGGYLPNLAFEIFETCQNKGVIYVDELIKIAKPILEKQAEQLYKKRNIESKDVKIFVFIVGFDKRSSPHLFYLDNQSQPPFEIREKILFQSGNDIEIAAMSPGSGNLEDPSAILSKYFVQEHQTNRKFVDISTIIRTAFECTKNELTKSNPSVGGEVYFLCIN